MISTEESTGEEFGLSRISELKNEFQCLALVLGLLVRGEDGRLVPEGKLMRWAANAAIKSLASAYEDPKAELRRRLAGMKSECRYGYLVKLAGEESYENGIKWLNGALNRGSAGGRDSNPITVGCDGGGEGERDR